MSILPATNLSFSLINKQLYRTATATYNINDTTGRKLASAGGTSTSAGQQIKASNFIGKARYIGSISTRTLNLNLITLANAAFPTGDAAAGRYNAGKTWISYSVNSGAVIGSSNTANPAITVPSTAGDIVEITINSGAYVVGAGGNGGRGSNADGSPSYSPGLPGGNALQAATTTTLVNNGVIGGGGGGGGGGDEGGGNSGGGGGGGAGFNVVVSGNTLCGGLGGAEGNGAKPGARGDLTTGGAGGKGDNSSTGTNGGDGGNGGNLGQQGAQGEKTDPTRGFGGLPGFAMVGPVNYSGSGTRYN